MNTSTRYRAATVVAAVLLLAGCSAASRGGGVDRDRLTRVQIESLDVSTLYQTVQRLRPEWLRTRGMSNFDAQLGIVVFQNQVQLGGVESLKQLSPDAAYEMRYLDGPEAAATLPGLGSTNPEGAIVILTSADSMN